MSDDDDVIIDISVNNQADIAYLQYKNHYLNELANKFKHEYDAKLVAAMLSRINIAIIVLSAIVTFILGLKLIVVAVNSVGFTKYSWFDILALVFNVVILVVTSIKQSKGWDTEPAKHKDSAKSSLEILDSILKVFTPFHSSSVNLTKDREDIESRVTAQSNAPDISEKSEKWFERTKNRNPEYIRRVEMFNRIDNSRTNKLIVRGINSTKEEKELLNPSKINELKVIDISAISDSSSPSGETSLQSELKKLGNVV